MNVAFSYVMIGAFLRHEHLLFAALVGQCQVAAVRHFQVADGAVRHACCPRPDPRDDGPSPTPRIASGNTWISSAFKRAVGLGDRGGADERPGADRVDCDRCDEGRAWRRRPASSSPSRRRGWSRFHLMRIDCNRPRHGRGAERRRPSLCPARLTPGASSSQNRAPVTVTSYIFQSAQVTQFGMHALPRKEQVNKFACVRPWPVPCARRTRSPSNDQD